MIDKEIIQAKSYFIERYFHKLKPELQAEVSDILHDETKLAAVERWFQLIVDAAIDINTHIIMESGFTIPDDNQNTFFILGQHGVLPYDFASKIAGSVGLRNALIHRYKDIDLKKMVRDMKENISQYLEYLKHINNFISRS